MLGSLTSRAFSTQPFYFAASNHFLNELQAQSRVSWVALGTCGWHPCQVSGGNQNTSADTPSDAQSQIADNNTSVVYSLTDQVSDIGIGGPNLSASGLEKKTKL